MSRRPHPAAAAAALFAALFATLMVCGQEPPMQVDISAQELLRGAGDRPLRELGARAAAGDLAVTVSAPAYWRERIVAAIAAGAGEVELDLTYRETIVESVLVRLSSKNETAIAPGSGPASAPQTGPAPPAPEADTSELDRAAARLKEDAREMVVSEADIPSAAELLAGSTRPEPSRPVAAGGSPPATGRPVESEPAAPDPNRAPEPDSPADDAAEPAADPAGGDRAEAGEPARITPAAGSAAEPAVREPRAEAEASLSRRLNDSRPIERRVGVPQLRPRDLLFTARGVIAVVRRGAVGREVYLLDGELDLAQSAVRKLEPGKYQVLKRIRGRAIAEPAAAPAPAEAAVAVDARRAMEIRYNEGRAVEATVSPAGLRPDDVLLVGDGEIMVVRRDRVGMKRYWLEGTLDLERDELESAGTRKYRVRRVIRD